MNIQQKWWACLSAIIAAILLGSSLAMAGIANTKHNLSVTGTGTYKATTETQICVYCHTPHNASPAALLWNHTLSTVTYTPYSSNTMKAAAPGQPTGASKLCLTCHDGTVALGNVRNLPRQHMASGTITGLAATILGTSASNLGADLRNDHPVSFTYDATLAAQNTELVAPASLPKRFQPGSDGLMQCNNCHDPHSETPPKFMLSPYVDAAGYGSPLCRTCHDKQYWATSPSAGHRDSNATWSGAGANPFHIPGQNLANSATSTPKINGCESCHRPHGATGNDHLLKNIPSTIDGVSVTNQSALCLVCHNGNVSIITEYNINTALNKASHHPVKDTTYAGRHSIRRQADGKIREDQANFSNTNRHSECTDCHNPHAAYPGRSPDSSTTTNLTTSLAPNTLKGVWGVEPTGYRSGGLAAWTSANQYSGYTIIDDVGNGSGYTYQVCFKCHSSWAFGDFPPPDPSGKVAGGKMTDVAREFNPNNKSFHPAAGTNGKNDFKFTRSGMGCPNDICDYSGSLLIGGTAPAQTIQVSCLECHSNRDPIAAEKGAKGVHGAATWPILYGPYDSTTGRRLNPNTSTHVCFRCHNFDTYTSSTYTPQPKTTGFSNGAKNLHAYHVGRKDMPCISCHVGVPHGWKRNHLLVFGHTLASDPGADPAPYNSHGMYPLDGVSDYGTPSTVGSQRGKTLDTIESGNWLQDDCHGPAIGVGSCG